MERYPDPAAAVRLQAGLDRLNESDPPTYNPPPFLANYRHPCAQARQAKMSGRPVSTAIDLKERYVTWWDEDGQGHTDPSHEEAILYREGVCAKCGQLARSRVGRIVLTDMRPPVSGRVGRK